MTGAGRMSHLVRFERRASGEVEYGSPGGAWTTLATVWAAWKPQFGREQIEAGRLESTTRGTLTVRQSAAARGIQASDQVVFVSGDYAGRTGNVRSIVPLHDVIEIVIEEGVAT